MAGFLKSALVRATGSRRLRGVSAAALKIPGIGGITRLLAHRLFPKGRRAWIQIASGPAKGIWLQADPYQEQRYFSGNPEPGVLETIARHLKPGDCFCDVGAHIGFYSLFAARRVGDNGAVFAFEPDPSNLEVLGENLARNEIHNAHVIPSAVWSSPGRVRFARKGVETGAQSSRQGSVVAPDAVLSSRVIEVEAVSLDGWAGVKPQLIKVDVEGAEAEVLAGAENLMATSKPTWLIEIHNPQAKAGCEAALKRHEYRIEWLPGHPGYAFPRHLLALSPC